LHEHIRIGHHLLELRELKEAIADDKLRAQVNDAKIKAMHDLVDYDTFKNRVSVAHLRPLQAASQRTDVSCSPASLFNADGSKMAANDSDFARGATLSTSMPTVVPKNNQEFERDWRRNCPTSLDKYSYVLLVPPEAFPQIFKVEITPTTLAEIIIEVSKNTLQTEIFQPHDLADAQRIVRALSALTGAGRFSLASKLIAPKAKQALKGLFDRLQEAATREEPRSGLSPAELDTLRAKWL